MPQNIVRTVDVVLLVDLQLQDLCPRPTSSAWCASRRGTQVLRRMVRTIDVVLLVDLGVVAALHEARPCPQGPGVDQLQGVALEHRLVGHGQR